MNLCRLECEHLKQGKQQKKTGARGRPETPIDHEVGIPETNTQYAIENYTDSSALFGTVQGAQLTNILLRDAVVTASDNMQNIGVLVDQMDANSVLSGCAVETAAIYLENEETTNPTQPAEQVEQTVQQNIGVLVGFSSGSIENFRVEELSINVQQKQNVGGLVGAMQADSLSERFTLKKKRWNWTL